MTMWVPFCYPSDRLDHLHWTTQIPSRALPTLNSQEKSVPEQYSILKERNIVAAHLTETFLCLMSSILFIMLDQIQTFARKK
jgi:hypothetical protein